MSCLLFLNHSLIFKGNTIFLYSGFINGFAVFCTSRLCYLLFDGCFQYKFFPAVLTGKSSLGRFVFLPVPLRLLIYMRMTVGVITRAFPGAGIGRGGIWSRSGICYHLFIAVVGVGKDRAAVVFLCLGPVYRFYAKARKAGSTGLLPDNTTAVSCI